MSDPDHAGEGHVVLCRVIVGNPEQVDVGSPRCHPSGDEFDSGVDDLEKPSWYIVWGTRMNTHILPEFVVSFKTSESGNTHFLSPWIQISFIFFHFYRCFCFAAHHF